MSDRAEALRLARELPAINVNAWVDPSALLLARALLDAEAEIARLTLTDEEQEGLREMLDHACECHGMAGDANAQRALRDKLIGGSR